MTDKLKKLIKENSTLIQSFVEDTCLEKGMIIYKNKDDNLHFGNVCIGNRYSVKVCDPTISDKYKIVGNIHTHHPMATKTRAKENTKKEKEIYKMENILDALNPSAPDILEAIEQNYELGCIANKKGIACYYINIPEDMKRQISRVKEITQTLPEPDERDILGYVKKYDSLLDERHSLIKSLFDTIRKTPKKIIEKYERIM